MSGRVARLGGIVAPRTPQGRGSAGPARHVAVIALLAGLGFATGCGPGALQLREGSLSQCADVAKGKERELLGWISVAPVDRWVAAADRLGARSQVLAPGSSLRDRVAGLMRDSAKKSGFVNADWFDWSRPIHVMLQVAEGEPANGTVVAVPVRGRDQFEQAAKPLLRPGEAGATAALLPTGTTKPMQLAWPHPTTMLMAQTGRRLEHARELANCAQVRKPEDLLQVGIVIDAVARHHGDKLNKALAQLAEESGGPFKSALAPYRELMRRAIEGSRTLEFGIADAGDDIVIDAHLQLRPDSDLSASFGRVAARGPSPLLARLPASAWLVSAATADLADSARQIEMSMAAWRGLVQNQPGVVEAIEQWSRNLYAVVGPYTAIAIHSDGEFPLAMTAIMSASEPMRLLSVLRDGSYETIRNLAQSRPDLQANLPAPLQAALTSGGWTALFQVAAAKLQGTPFTLTTMTQNADGLECEVLRVDIDPSSLGGGNPMMARAMGMIGPRLEAGLCAGNDAVLAVFGHDAVALAGAAARPGREDALPGTPWFHNAFGSRPASTLFGLQPGLLFAIARTMLPTVPAWPEQAAITLGCHGTAKEASCRLGLPAVAIANASRTVRAMMTGGR